MSPRPLRAPRIISGFCFCAQHPSERQGGWDQERGG